MLCAKYPGRIFTWKCVTNRKRPSTVKCDPFTRRSVRHSRDQQFGGNSFSVENSLWRQSPRRIFSRRVNANIILHAILSDQWNNVSLSIRVDTFATSEVDEFLIKKLMSADSSRYPTKSSSFHSNVQMRFLTIFICNDMLYFDMYSV